MTAPILTTAREVEALAEKLAGAPRIGLDIESNGMFVYKATACTAQLSWGDEVVVVDTLVAPMAALACVLGVNGPPKIVHDVSLDARLLAELGIDLGNVHDTSIAARMLGRTATGLSNLLAAELGVTVDKTLQHADWGLRPLDDEKLEYLARDVMFLERLATKLWAEVHERGIEAEVLEETRYRVDAAIRASREVDERPPYVRMKSIDRCRGVELAIVRGLAQVREREAQARDVPPHKILSAESIYAIARSRPAIAAQVQKLSSSSSVRDEAFVAKVLAAVADGLARRQVPDEERHWLERPRIAREVADVRRAREQRLTAWRRETAKARGLDEQVVLPGHCLRAIVDREATDEEALSLVAGLGAFRVARDGAAIAAVMLADPETSEVPA